MNQNLNSVIKKLKNKSVTEMVEILKKYDRVTRIYLYKKVVQETENFKLANRINEANKIINQVIVNTFKNSVIKGNYPEFLKKLSLTDKIFLKVDLNLNKANLNYEEFKYLQILNQTIKNNLEKEYQLIRK